MADITKATDDVTIFSSDGTREVEVTTGNELRTADYGGMNEVSYQINQGKGFVYTTNSISVSGSSEVDFALFLNPNGSGVTAKIFHLFVSMLAGTTSDYGIFRSYRNPTITSNGTAATINKILSSGTASALSAYTAPTISARGTLLTSYPVIDSQISIDMHYLLFVPPNENLLVTAQPSQTNKLHTVTMRWIEV